MRRLQIFIAAIVVVCVVVATGITACNDAYPGAFAAGRAEGYKAGDAAGYNRGENDGYQKGLTAGSAADNTILIAQAKKDGYDDG